MPAIIGVLLGVVLVLLLPAQVESAPNGRRVTADFGVQYAPVCSGLEPEECCEQMLEVAAFRAQGDQLPRLVKGLVRLACRDQRRVLAPQACRSIAVLRGFHGGEVDAICGPALRECIEETTCNKCTLDLKRLRYRGAEYACRALTYLQRR